MSTDAEQHAAAPRTQSERRAATEARLLEAAFDIVDENGVNAVTTAAVGQRAGYSRGIVNHHFGSRGQLMLRLAEYAQQRFVPAPGHGNGRERILDVIDQYLALAQTKSSAIRVFLRLWAAAAAGEEPGLSDTFATRDAFFRDYFEDVIQQGVDDGSIRANIDARAVAIAIMGLIRGIAMQYQYNPDLAEVDSVREVALTLVDHGLHGTT